MVNRMCAVFGLGLLVVWVVGLSNPTASSWINWLDGMAALAAFSIAAFLPAYSSRRIRSAAPGLISFVLAVLWIAGMSTGVVSWQRWANALFAIAFGALSFFVTFERRAPIEEYTPTETKASFEAVAEKERQRFRKGA